MQQPPTDASGAIILLTGPMRPDPWLAAFRARAGARPILASTERAAGADIRYAVVWQPPPGALRGLGHLSALFSLGAGVDFLFGRDDLPEVPIVRLVASDLTGRMSEWVTLQALMHLRQQRRYDRQQADRLWRPLPQVAAPAVSVGVMGLGVLGEDAAAVLARLGFNVAGWSRRPKTLPGIETFHGDDGLSPFLARTDMLVVLLPLTPETRGILDGRLFAGLRRGGALGGPVLINAGRGGLQVEADILAALDSGVLAGASLDVFDPEPLPQASRLWRHEKVILTPHVAADSDPQTLAESVLTQIEAFEAGGPLQNLVDRAAGY